MKWSELKMKWRQLRTNLCQFRLRSLLLFVLAVQLAFAFGIPLRTWYLRYQETRSDEATAAMIRADCDRLGPEFRASLDGTTSSLQTYERPILPPARTETEAAHGSSDP